MHSRTRKIVSTAALSMLSTAGLAQGATFSWDAGGGASTGFSMMANWNPTGLPGSADYAVINTPDVTVTLDSSPVTSLSFLGNGGSGTGNVTVNETGGSRTWTSTTNARFEGAGTVIFNGADFATGALLFGFDTSLRINSGSQFTASSLSLGDVGAPSDYGLIDVNAGGTLTVTSFFSQIGRSGRVGTLNVNAGAATLSSVIIASVGAGTEGALNILNAGSVTQSVGSLNIGSQGEANQAGSMSISGAGSRFSYLASQALHVGTTSNSTGVVTIGSGSNFNVGNGAASLNINATGAMTINGGSLSSSGSVNVNGGVLSLNSGTIAMGAGATMRVFNSGQLNAAGYSVGPTGTLALSANGRLACGGALTVGALGAGTATISSGTLSAGSTFVGGNSLGPVALGFVQMSSGTMSVAGLLKVWDTGTVVINGGAFSCATLELSGGQFQTTGSGKVIRVNAVSVDSAGGSKLDLAGNGMIVDYAGASPFIGLRSLLVNGYASGAWTGNGIASSSAAAAASTTTATAIAYAEATDLFTTFPATFLGQAVDSTAVLMRYTLSGDATMDLAVNGADFNILASNFGGTNKRWTLADFTYDLAVNGADFNLLAGNFGKTLASGPGEAVPEPAFIGLAASAAIFLARRRRI